MPVDLRGAECLDQRIPVGILRIELGQRTINVVNAGVGDDRGVAEAWILAGEAADKLDGNGDALVRVVQGGDLQFRQIETFAEHVHADNDPALEAPQSGKVCTAFTDRLLAMDDDRTKFWVHLAVKLVEGSGAVDSLATRHGEMVEADVQITLEDFAELSRDREIGVCLIEPEDRLEANRLEIAFGLRLLERIGVDELAVDAPAVLTEWCGGELDDRERWLTVRE